jgi:hypothetical protein
MFGCYIEVASSRILKLVSAAALFLEVAAPPRFRDWNYCGVYGTFAMAYHEM